MTRDTHLKIGLFIFINIICLSIFATIGFAQNNKVVVSKHSKNQFDYFIKVLPEEIPRFSFDAELPFEYPDAVRGIYVTGYSAGGSKFPKLMNLIDKTDLNAMVIDIKDDWGNLTYIPAKNSPYYMIGKNYIKNPKTLLVQMQTNKIYPIARIVVFKDTILAKMKPNLSFKKENTLWANRKGDSYTNPFIKEVWDYNIGIAIEAAKLGFKEIQFDYVRYPEGFEKYDKSLTYSKGEYGKTQVDNVQRRVQAITDFVKYAKEKLKPYDVKVSVDIFGYTATLPEAPGIGQNFSKIAEEVDVISSMIYPSHWTSYFGIVKPDLQPYQLVAAYAKVEKSKLKLLKSPPITRPWIQDFTATWLGNGNYQVYGKKEVEAQIRALNEQGIHEFLLWNASNNYTKNVDYTPLN
jgi:hypothetical protein